MVYKRKAHVLFVGCGDTSRATLATAIANTLGQRYMLARAVGMAAEPLLPELQGALHTLGLDPTDPLLPLDASHLQWADLVIALDEAVAQAFPQLPQGVQIRCYPFPSPENAQHLYQVRDAIQQRIAGMVGGMAMLA